MRRLPVAAAFVVALCAILPVTSAMAENTADLGESIKGLEMNIKSLEKNIIALERNVEEFEPEVVEDGAVTQMILSSDVLFDYGSSALSETAKAKITEFADQIPRNATIDVGGHTDNIPLERGNDVLSQERAQAVADAITASRSDVTPIVTGYGDTQPVADNTNSDGTDNPGGREQNRRVEIRYGG